MTRTAPIRLSRAALDHIAPFNILWDAAGRIVAVSPHARDYLGLTARVNAVHIVHPFTAPLTPALFAELTHLIVQIAPTPAGERVIKGELVHLMADQLWLFSGMPPIDSLTDLDRVGVHLNQLPLHLGLGDLLLATESARMSLAESRRVQTALEASTQALRERTQQLETERARLHREVSEHRSARRQLEIALEELRRVQAVLVQQERLKAVGEMVGGIAHDFNNILTPIVAYAALLQAELTDDPEHSALINTIMTAARDAGALIERLQRLYRPSDTAVEYTAFAINALAEDALALARPRWRALNRVGNRRRVTHRLGATGDMTGLQSDLRRALLNLLFNASDATEDGGAVILETASTADTVILSVADTGHGMTPDTLEQCTLPFYSTKGTRGTGLGLPMVFEAAVRHGGTVLIESERGIGTRVSLALPRTLTGDGDPAFRASSSELSTHIRIRARFDPFSDAPDFQRRSHDLALADDRGRSGALDRYVARATHSAAPAPPAGPPRFGAVDRNLRVPAVRPATAPADPIDARAMRLLIVEDDALIATALSRVAIRQGHTVRTATHGLQALERLQAETFDLVICDLHMPGMRGDALAVMIRKQLPDITLLIYTGNPDGVDEAGRAAVDLVIAKPSGPGELLSRALERVRARRTAGS